MHNEIRARFFSYNISDYSLSTHHWKRVSNQTENFPVKISSSAARLIRNIIFGLKISGKLSYIVNLEIVTKIKPPEKVFQQHNQVANDVDQVDE